MTRVQKGQEITITRHGEPIAVLVRPDALRIRRAAAVLAEADEIRGQLIRARFEPVSTAEGMTLERADELVDDIRAGRDRR